MKYNKSTPLTSRGFPRGTINIHNLLGGVFHEVQ